MNRFVKILLLAVLFTGVSMNEKICNHLGFGPNLHHDPSEVKVQNNTQKEDIVASAESYYVSDSLFKWDEHLLEWVNTGREHERELDSLLENVENHPSDSPIEIDWKILLDIEYKLRYFKELDMEVYAPVFSKALKALHGKEVVIQGFVIPFYEEEEIISLSQNPFAACFFCGKASPASIISLYLKDNGPRYKMDDFLKFKGRLYLNYDDPNEFYYILREAKEVRR